MKKFHVLFAILFIAQLINAQESLDDVLKRYNKNDVPYISVQELAMPKNNVIIMDARELSEFEISHLKDAVYVGYNDFELEPIEKLIPQKDKEIVVYCSLGIRSEIIADRLKNAGYTKVKNLYGGIFEWKNKDFNVYNSEHKETDSIHTYSEQWSKWLIKGIKVYE